jgi:pyruvate formate lyase activating enzyme
MTQGIVLDIQRGAMNDGPGIRTTVFLKGCMLGCPWCHNPESRSGLIQMGINRETTEKKRLLIMEKYNLQITGDCELIGIDGNLPSGLTDEYPVYGRSMTAEEVMEVVRRDRHYYKPSGGGITISGGEPLYQPEFLLELLRLSRKEGIHTCLDTSGYSGNGVLSGLIPFVDLFLYDIKLMDPQLHRKYTGGDLNRVLDNLNLLVKKNCRVIIRSPVIPGINDNARHFDELKKLRSGFDEPLKIELLPYHDYYLSKFDRLPDPAPDIPSIPENFVERIRKVEHWLNRD